jgi:hypothetical protein
MKIGMEDSSMEPTSPNPFENNKVQALSSSRIGDNRDFASSFAVNQSMKLCILAV